MDGDGLQISKNIFPIFGISGENQNESYSDTKIFFFLDFQTVAVTVVHPLYFAHKSQNIMVGRQRFGNLQKYTIRFVLIFFRDAKNRKNIFEDLQTIAVYPYNFELYKKKDRWTVNGHGMDIFKKNLLGHTG
jgi:hypothetical protein